MPRFEDRTASCRSTGSTCPRGRSRVSQGFGGPVEGGGKALAFLTCEPNGLVAPVHPKAMPVILHDEDEERWLRGELGDLAAPYPSQLMRMDGG